MRKFQILLFVTIITTVIGGCILSKTPSTNDVSMNLGEQKVFSVKVFPPATYVWTLDGAPLSNTENSYTYIALEGEHTLMVCATHIFGTNTQTWNIQVVIAFNKTFGETATDFGHRVQQMSDGGYILAATTESYGAGTRDFWLIKTDMNGNKIWDKTFGGGNWDIAYAVHQTSDSGYILAGYTESFGAGGGDFWLIKTDADGNKVWDRTFGGSNHDQADDMQQTSDGGYILLGMSQSYGAGGADFLLIKTDADGNKVWDKTFGGASSDYPFAIQQTSDGGYIMTGRTYSYGAGNADAWLIKTDADGNKVWDKTFGGSDLDEAYTLQQTIDGGYILAGRTYSFGAGGGDAWLIKTDTDGNKVWDKTFGGSLWDEAFFVKQTSNGGFILTGWTESYAVGSWDAWLIKTDANGNKVWDKIFGGNGLDYGTAVQQTSDGGYIMTGLTESYGAGGWDAWLIKTDSDGNAPATPTPK